MSISIDNVASFQDLQSQPETQGGSDLGEDSFMKLLVTQLQHQNPLEPQANEEFVAQLAQFSSLEQLTNANSALESLYLAMASMNNASMTQLLGKQVKAYGDSFHYSGDGSVDLYYDAPQDCSATITITDESGSVVYTEELGALSPGEGSYTWDGNGISGDMDEGTYSFSISAESSSGEPVEVTTLVIGEIDGMSFVTGAPEPSIEGVPLGLGDILEVFSTKEDAEASVDPDSDGTDEDAG